MCSISVVMSYFNKPCHVCCFERKQLYRSKAQSGLQLINFEAVVYQVHSQSYSIGTISINNCINVKGTQTVQYLLYISLHTVYQVYLSSMIPKQPFCLFHLCSTLSSVLTLPRFLSLIAHLVCPLCILLS